MVEQHLKLCLTGDVMTGRGIDQILPNPSVPVLHEPYVADARHYITLAERKNGRIPEQIDHRYIWGAALDVLAEMEPDVCIVNLETSITTSEEFWPGKGIHYRMHPHNLPCLTAASIDCCVLANNHVMDWGYPGLEETLSTLHGVGISTVGAGVHIDQAARPARHSIDGKGSVLVFGFADTSSGVPDGWRATQKQAGVHLLDDLSAETAEKIASRILARKKPNDIVVASIHWGGNWGYDVSAEQRHFAHYLIDNSDVAVVHGHSSHHAKAIEIYHGKPIIYGSGDFLNDYEGIGGHEQYRPWLSLMYFVTIHVSTGRLEHFEIVPLHLLRFRLTETTADDRRWLGDKLNDVSKQFATGFEMANGRLRVRSLPLDQRMANL